MFTNESLMFLVILKINLLRILLCEGNTMKKLTNIIKKLFKSPLNYVPEQERRNDPFRNFEDRHNPGAFRADIQAMGIPKEFAVNRSRLYETLVYRPTIKEYLKINDENDFNYRTG